MLKLLSEYLSEAAQVLIAEGADVIVRLTDGQDQCAIRKLASSADGCAFFNLCALNFPFAGTNLFF